MPSPKINRRGQEEKSGRRTRLTEKSSSFHGRSEISMATQLHRPKTVPELLSYRRVVGPVSSKSLSLETRPKLTKLLLNVTIQGSLGAVHVIISPESKVGDVIVTAVRQYAKEFRRPILPSIDPIGFDLHYSQFSLESLDREEKLIELGSRNFFLCMRKSEKAKEGGVTTSCSKEAEKAAKNNSTGFVWLRFMEFML